MMRSVLAATITLDDLKKYFTGKGTSGSTWRSTVRDDGTFDAQGNIFHVEIAPGGSPSFHVKVQAHEDESDSDEAVTDEPMKFLTDFLKTGTAGDAAMQQMAGVFRKITSMPPVGMANFLRHWADDVEARRVGPRTLARLLRRASLMPDMPQSLAFLAAAVRLATRADVEAKEMTELAKKMKEKGWRVDGDRNDRGLPELTVDIAGVYEAKIEIDHMPWKYSFEVLEHPDTHSEGITDDPIAEFRRYAETDEVETAKAAVLEKAHSKGKTPEAEEGTIKPGSRPKPEHHDPYESGAPS
jgi:hypothetical protein